MYKLLHKKDALWTLFQEARRESAIALAEEASEIADELAALPDKPREDVALAKLRIEPRRLIGTARARPSLSRIRRVVPTLELMEPSPAGGDSCSRVSRTLRTSFATWGHFWGHSSTDSGGVARPTRKGVTAQVRFRGTA